MSKPRRQCDKCPWRKDVDPNDIPHGYCDIKHRQLKDTIAKPGELDLTRRLKVMACHEARPGKEIPCVGWMVHQYGPGNNIAFRLAVIKGRFDMNVETVGEQHERFEDTLP